MIRFSAIGLAALIAASPLSQAVAQERLRPERQQEDERPRISMGEAVQRASSGRPGRFLGASDRGIVAILDSRIVTKTYGRTFIDTLPGGLPRTSAIEQDRRWWLSPQS